MKQKMPMLSHSNFLVVFVLFASNELISVSPTSSKMPELMTTVSVVSDSHVAKLGEGPYWDTEEEVLYYVDALAGEFHRLNPENGQRSRVTLSGLVSFIIPYSEEPGHFIVSNVNKLLKLNWKSNKTTPVATVAPELNGLERFNDAKCDRKGRLFIGTVLESSSGGSPITEGGSLYRLQGSTLVKVTSGFTITNGMAWSNDPHAKKFYLNDSEGRKIYAFDYNIKDGTLSNKVVMIDCDTHPDFVPNEYPDGMAIDRYGFLWIAMWNGGRVVRVNPETGRVIDQVVLLSVQIPSSVAFGNYKGKFGLYVTTASTGISSDKLKDDGKIHHIAIHGGDVKGFDPTAV